MLKALNVFLRGLSVILYFLIFFFTFSLFAILWGSMFNVCIFSKIIDDWFNYRLTLSSLNLLLHLHTLQVKNCCRNYRLAVDEDFWFLIFLQMHIMWMFKAYLHDNDIFPQTICTVALAYPTTSCYFKIQIHALNKASPKPLCPQMRMSFIIVIASNCSCLLQTLVCICWSNPCTISELNKTFEFELLYYVIQHHYILL